MTIGGLQRLQADLNRAAAATRPSGLLGRAVKRATAAVHRYAVKINPVDTGSWRASQHQRFDAVAARGYVFVNEQARNSRTGIRVLDYASDWEDRGGRYAIYRRTIDEAGEGIIEDAGHDFMSKLADML